MHLCIASVNVVLGGQLIGANADANRFFRLSVERASVFHQYTWDLSYLTNGTNGFLNLHSLAQRLAGPSFFLAHAVTVLGVGICLLYLAEFWIRCGGKKEWLPKIFFYYTCFPSILLFHSYILREVWQAACVFAIANIILRIQQDGADLSSLIKLLFFLLVGSLTHSAMPLMLVSEALAMSIGYSLTCSESTSWAKNCVIAIGVLTTGGLIISSSTFLDNSEESLQLKAERYGQRASALDARADYGSHFEASRPWTLIPTFLAYQLEPLIWRVKSLTDFIPLVENFIRLYLLYLFLRYRKRTKSLVLAAATASLFGWVGIEAIWSLGTVNWGTAVRHHTSAYGLLFVSAMVVRQEYQRVTIQKRFKLVGSTNRIAA